MTDLVGIWRVEDEGGRYVVYSGDTRLSDHATLGDAEAWMMARYHEKMAELREEAKESDES